MEEAGVGSGELVGGEFCAGNPGDGEAMNRAGLALKQFAAEEFEADGFFGVGVGDFLDFLMDGDFDGEFLAEFTREALLEGFAGVELAAGEFPKAAEMLVERALGDEKL